MQPIEHGSAGADASSFVRVLPRRNNQLDRDVLARLASLMNAEPDETEAGPDGEENMYVPAGYTYLGQFIDHDLTSIPGNTSFDGGTPIPPNARTPLLDLDCVYGDGPEKSPEMFEDDGVRMRLGTVIDPAFPDRLDLLRGPHDRAIIGDPRNDENSIVSQIQSAFIAFHNQVAGRIKHQTGKNGQELFEAARNQVRWTYQHILLEDYVPRIIDKDVIQQFETERKPDACGKSTNKKAFRLYPERDDIRKELPLEFTAAAYRFGHSMVRNGYFLRADPDGEGVPIFVTDPTTRGESHESLVGFDKLSPEHLITDWRRFFPESTLEGTDHFAPAPGEAAGDSNGANNAPPDSEETPRLQFAYRIDTSIVNPLANLPQVVADRGTAADGTPLPSINFLAMRNLWRSIAFGLASGQDAEKALGIQESPASKSLVTRVRLDVGAPEKKVFRFEPIPEKIDITVLNGDGTTTTIQKDTNLLKNTPLWFYILAEALPSLVQKFGIGQSFEEDDMLASAKQTGTQLGPVGGRILLEVFHGILDSDPTSYRNHPDAVHFKSMLKKLRMWDLVTLNLT